MRTMSNNIEIAMVNKTNQNIKELFEILLKKSQQQLEETKEEVNLFLIALIYSSIIFLKQVQIVVDHVRFS